MLAPVQKPYPGWSVVSRSRQSLGQLVGHVVRMFTRGGATLTSGPKLLRKLFLYAYTPGLEGVAGPRMDRMVSWLTLKSAASDLRLCIPASARIADSSAGVSLRGRAR